MAKSNIRSFRYTDEVRKILDDFAGNTMNEKFENLVLYCHSQVPAVAAKLAKLDDEIKFRQEKLSGIRRETEQIDWMIEELREAKRKVELVSRRAAGVKADLL